MYQELFELVESVGKLNDKVEKTKELKEDDDYILYLILLYEKFLQFNWLRAVVFQLNLK